MKKRQMLKQRTSVLEPCSEIPIKQTCNYCDGYTSCWASPWTSYNAIEEGVDAVMGGPGTLCIFPH